MAGACNSAHPALSLLVVFSCGTVKCQHPTARVRNAMEKKKTDEFLEGTDDDDEE